MQLSDGLALRVARRSPGNADYPTGALQRGLLLSDGDDDLAEEGVGFGVPVLKRGVQTIFAGEAELAWQNDGPLWTVTAAFAMGLVERLEAPDGATLRSRSLYAAKDALAALHRRAPVLRRPLTATSNALRRTFGWTTTFEPVAASEAATLLVTYSIDAGGGRVGVALDLAAAPPAGATEIILMNEQGARHFDGYADADGASLRGREIGTWDEVFAARASFIDAVHGVAFTLDRVDGARLFRGRELIGSRVAWSGFGYSVPPTVARFSYDLTIGRTS